MTTRHAIVLLGLLGFTPAAAAQDFRIEDAAAARLLARRLLRKFGTQALRVRIVGGEPRRNLADECLVGIPVRALHNGRRRARPSGGGSWQWSVAERIVPWWISLPDM